MNAQTLNRLMASYQDHQELLNDEYIALSKSLRSSPELLRQMVDDRAVDGMLQLMTADELDEDDFVARCLEKMPQESVHRSTDSDCFRIGEAINRSVIGVHD